MKNGIYSLILVLLVACNANKQKSLVGLWQLKIIEAKDSIGNWQEADWMKNGTGLLHYGNDGNMSVHFWPDSSQTPNAVPYWYVANYHTRKDTVYHKRLMHAIPSENNKTAKRVFNINDDTLLLMAPDYGFRLTWTKK